jgi:hypothetical protein
MNNPKAFTDDTATVVLGVGVNMVHSIRYWLGACGIMSSDTLQPTPLGEYLFDAHSGRDPYLEDEATLWLIHWALATNRELATAWYWFFNKFHKSDFTAQEAATALSDWVKANLTTKVAPTTVKGDASLLLRMYTPSRGNTRTPIEEALDSPLSLLRLITQTAGGRSFASAAESRPNLPVGIFGYALTELMQHRGTSVPIEELMYGSGDMPALGRVRRRVRECPAW